LGFLGLAVGLVEKSLTATICWRSIFLLQLNARENKRIINVMIVWQRDDGGRKAAKKSGAVDTRAEADKGR